MERKPCSVAEDSFCLTCFGIALLAGHGAQLCLPFPFRWSPWATANHGESSWASQSRTGGTVRLPAQRRNSRRLKHVASLHLRQIPCLHAARTAAAGVRAKPWAAAGSAWQVVRSLRCFKRSRYRSLGQEHERSSRACRAMSDVLSSGRRRGRSSGPTATGQLHFRSGRPHFQPCHTIAAWGSLRKENWVARQRRAQKSTPRKLCIATAG